MKSQAGRRVRFIYGPFKGRKGRITHHDPATGYAWVRLNRTRRWVRVPACHTQLRGRG